MSLHSRRPVTPPSDPLDIRLRPVEIPSPPCFRPLPRPGAIPDPMPLLATRPPLDLLDHHDQEPLRISFHEEERDLDMRGSRHSLSRPTSCKSGGTSGHSAHDVHRSMECILPPGPFERATTASLGRSCIQLDIDDDEDPYPSLQHVRTSASGLLRFPDDGLEEGEEEGRPCPVLQRGEENHSQSRLLPSPYPYWGDEEDVQSPPRDPFVGLQKQMKIMNRNLTGKLEEMNGMQNVDTHVALSEIRGQLHELTRSVESCQTDVCEVKRDMIAIKHEIDSVQLVKDEIDDIRESLDRLEAESQRRKNKLLEQGLTFFLAYSIFSAVLGMLQFGYNTGVINAPEQVIEKFIRKAHRQRSDGVNMTYESSTFMYAIAVSIFAIGGMCGGFIGGWIANKFGRKGGLLMNNLIGIVAAMAMVFSKHVTSYELLIIGRYLIGVNCGLNTSLVPMYISEIAPLNLRGGLGTVNQLAVTVGLLTSQVLGVDYLLGTDEGWPYLLGIAVFPSILQMVLLPICPESPRYLLISKGQEQGAREALKRLRNTPNIEDDIDEMRAEEQAQQAEAQITMFELLRSPTLRMPLTIAIMMQLSQQLSGINAVFYYSTNLFITTGLSETSAKYATIGIGSVMVLMTLVSIPLMDRSGRRTLHLYGLGGMFIFSIFITISFLVKELVSWIWWLSVVSTLFYVVFFAVGPGSIPWMITAELFSQGPRPAAMSVAVLINWCANFLVAIGFPTMQTMLENYTFLPFSMFLAVFWIFTYKKVPETKNKTFDEIATLFKIQNKQKNLVNCVNNIAQINTDCGPHPQLSPEGKKHENHQMSPDMIGRGYHQHSGPDSPRSSSRSPPQSPCSGRSRGSRSERGSHSPGSPQSQASHRTEASQASEVSKQSRSSRLTKQRSRSQSPEDMARLPHNCISPPIYPRNYPFQVDAPRQYPDARYPH